MTEQEREYWLAGGADKVKAEAFIRDRGEAVAKMDLAARAHGGIAISNGRSITGLTFEGDHPPPGWTKKGDCDGRPFFLPKRSSKDLRAISDDLASHRVKGAAAFHSLMCSGDRNGGVMKSGNGPGFGMRIIYAVWEWIGEDLILSIPIGAEFTPDGSRKLAMSEYWAMKEALAAPTPATGA